MPRRAAAPWAIALGVFAAITIAYFAPVLFTGRLMASGDALIESVPAYLGPRSLWTDGILLGYPLFADPNQQYWYPLMVLRIIPGSFNAFAVLPYLIAAYGMFGFAYALTRSRFAASVAGLTYAFSGFMIAHEGHLMITHPAAWSPFALWAAEELRSAKNLRWLVAGAGAIALMLLGGQPQVTLLALAIVVSYALVAAIKSTVDAGRYLSRIAAMVGCGLGFGAVILIPALELTLTSTRSGLSFADFANFALSPQEIAVRMIFPYFLGFSASPLFPFSHIEVGSFTELTLYVGMAPMLLALIGVQRFGDDHRVLFWLAVALFAPALAAGDAFGLATITYHLPGFGLFRIPGRHAFDFAVATSVLSAYGLAAMERSTFRPAETVRAIGLGVALVLLATLTLRLDWGGIDRAVGAALGAEGFTPHNPAIWIPLMLFIVAALTAATYRAIPRPIARALLLATLASDWLLFGWSAYWNWAAATSSALVPPAALASVVNESRQNYQRIYWTAGVKSGDGPRPNLVLLWNEPSVGGYTPLEVTTTAALLNGVDTRYRDAALDLASARYVIGPLELKLSSATDPFGNTNLDRFIGAEGTADTDEAVLGVPQPLNATRLSLVTALGDAVQIAQGTRVAQVSIEDTRGQTIHLALIAGVNTAEFAYERSDVLPYVRHARARVFRVDPQGAYYRADLPIRDETPIRVVRIQWNRAIKRGGLTILKASLIDDARGAAIPFGDLASYYADSTHWSQQHSSAFTILRNRAALPRAWIVERVVASDDALATRIIHTGELHDHHFDPRKVALVDPGAGISEERLSSGNVRINGVQQGEAALDVMCHAACLVVTSDTWYAGWVGSVDDRIVPIVRVDLALRGIVVPPGRHKVHFRYAPTSLKVGAAASLLSFLLLTVLWFRKQI